jgi:predicted DNA-binding transcriptional regulator AlpA
MALRLLRLAAVEDLTGMRKTQIYLAMERGLFPKPVQVFETGRAVGWIEGELIGYLNKRIAARDAKQQTQQAAARPRGRPRKGPAMTSI